METGISINEKDEMDAKGGMCVHESHESTRMGYGRLRARGDVYPRIARIARIARMGDADGRGYTGKDACATIGRMELGAPEDAGGWWMCVARLLPPL